MAAAWDDFTEASPLLLESHTPTGPNAGASWVNSSGTADVRVGGGTGTIFDNTGSNSHRYRMSTNLGSDLIDVQIELTSNSATSTFPGVGARVDTGSGLGVELLWDATNNRWDLNDQTNPSATAADTWPGGIVTMRLLIPGDGKMYGFANGVLKVTLTSNEMAGNNFAGIIFGNFSGTSGAHTGDNFKAESYALRRPVRLNERAALIRASSF